ncbi:ABC transporter ATP-binding protein [Fontibacter flavus]|uniref:ABC transporter ATP-binding protein n=1 Tax=Fontibacter flavus TaxID=654838 RepID=A0ABV6FU93_9BACT|nr:ATP-binding cassette domain-containing protein [Cyclobacteriaceae bacterium]
MDILEIQNLNKSFGPTKALTNINLQIPKGVIFGLLGPNGAGKTTLIRIINQIIDSDSGSVYFKGEPLVRKHIANIGYLPEERGLYKKMKVWDQLIYFARLKGLTAEMAKERVDFWLKKMEISLWKDKRIDDLSKGMAQKIQFISTVIHEPELLILDEPFSGFDPVNAEIIKDQIIELKNKGITFLLSTHRMESVELLCEQIAMFHQSEKILEGSLNEVKSQFKPNEYEINIHLTSTQIPKNWNRISSYDNDTFRVPLNGKSTNELLEEAMQFGLIKGFSEVLPTMEEIFIQQVKNYNNG